jgi:hypothetical protein
MNKGNDEFISFKNQLKFVFKYFFNHFKYRVYALDDTPVNLVVQYY